MRKTNVDSQKNKHRILRSISGDTEQHGYFPVTASYSPIYSENGMKISTCFAVAEAIHSGITTVCDYNHNARNPEFLLAGCDALVETNIRAQVLYGNYRNKEESTKLRDPYPRKTSRSNYAEQI